ncbi:ATP-grasp domain-containing protein [Enterocloster sp. OA13]|uniref:ATP-grasp domain-containing protein n=1 Tax=Enterocloster sp. OA13 TaxID=2914161 RepID=UPI0004718578|nr:ATP-grasp domain-containing protein [Enterocloster sp. OA13]
MRTLILYPSDYFNIRKPDPDYEYEYREAVRFPDLMAVFYNYDEFAVTGRLKFYPVDLKPGPCIYRGWMLKPDQYGYLYDTLLEQDVRLVNSPEEYRLCHEFPNVYPYIKGSTPRMTVFRQDEPVDWQEIRKQYGRFLIKDYVKSVKGSDFPAYFDASYTDQQLDGYLERFKNLRGSLFDGGIVIKEYVDLAKVQGRTNEYRAFILDGNVLSVTANSNQDASRPRVPMSLVRQFTGLNSHFYTVDFAELEDGSWTIIETGDGQVSGLSPNQLVFPFYEGIANRG